MVTLREQIETYRKTGEIPGEFSHCHGFYGWFCSDSALPAKAKNLMAKTIKFCKLMGVDLDAHIVYFKNNCPATGKTYDEFRIKNIHTLNNIWQVIPNYEGEATIWYHELSYGEHPTYIASSWSELMKNIVPFGWTLPLVTI